MSKSSERAMEDIKRAISDATGPKVMSKAEALDFIGELSDDLAMQCECLRDEIASEEE